MVLGTLAIAVLTYYATAHHNVLTRLTMSVIGAGPGLLIVVLENTL